jgi:hypothetical protein
MGKRNLSEELPELSVLLQGLELGVTCEVEIRQYTLRRGKYEQDLDAGGGGKEREGRRTANVFLVDEDVRNGARIGLLSEVSLYESKRLSRQYVRATRKLGAQRKEDETKGRTWISAPSSSMSKS